MKKKLLITLEIIIIILVVIFGLRLIAGEEDTWLCVNNEWVKHGNPSKDKPTTGCGNIQNFNANQNINVNININANTNDSVRASDLDFPEIDNEADCLAQGAEWLQFGRSHWFCQKRSPDEGKVCQKATDCLIMCIIENGDSISGTCSGHSGVGCYRYLDENGEPQMICVD